MTLMSAARAVSKEGAGSGSETDGKHRKLTHESVAERSILQDFETGQERSLMRCVTGSGGVDVEERFQRLK